jgi:tRNA A37 methylthiotransferase MiaB
MMGRVAAKVTCSDKDQAELERLSASRTEQAHKVERARIVLGCLAGARNDTIAKRMELQANTVSIQALQRKTGYVQTSSGKVVRGIQSTYKRHGTVNLFAALNVATGGFNPRSPRPRNAATFRHLWMTSLWTTTPRTRKKIPGWP